MCGYSWEASKNRDGSIAQPDWNRLSREHPRGVASYAEFYDIHKQAAAYFGVDFEEVWSHDPVFEDLDEAYEDYYEWYFGAESKVVVHAGEHASIAIRPQELVTR